MHHPSGLDLVSPTKKKRKQSLNQGEVLDIIKLHERNIRAAAEQIASEEFMGIPVEDIPTQDLADMEETIEKLRKRIGKLMNSEIHSVQVLLYSAVHLYGQRFVQW